MAIKYNTKAIVTIPAWAEALHEGTGVQRDTINSAAAAYAFVPLVNRAVRLRADSLISTPLYFTKLDGETEVPAPFDGLDWKDLIWKTEAALCLQGANYIERMPRAMSKKTGALKWINPITVKVCMASRASFARHPKVSSAAMVRRVVKNNSRDIAKSAAPAATLPHAGRYCRMNSSLDGKNNTPCASNDRIPAVMRWIFWENDNRIRFIGHGKRGVFPQL